MAIMYLVTRYTQYSNKQAVLPLSHDLYLGAAHNKNVHLQMSQHSWRFPILASSATDEADRHSERLFPSDGILYL